jgi:hypothetical protein
MIGRRSTQLGLFEGDHLWLDHVGRGTLYGFLALHRGFVFADTDFAAMFASGGRASVPPSLLATALLLQLHDGVSDDEARDRAAFDARWKVALGLEMERRPFSTSTLRGFRQQMSACPEARRAFARGLAYVRRHGFAMDAPEEERPRPLPAPGPGAAPAPARSVPRVALTEAAW